MLISRARARRLSQLAVALALASLAWNGYSVYSAAGSATAMLFSGAAVAVVVFGWTTAPDLEDPLKSSVVRGALSVARWATPNRRCAIIVAVSMAITVTATLYGTLAIRDLAVTCRDATDLHWRVLKPEAAECEQGRAFRYWATLGLPEVHCGYPGKGEWRNAELTEERLICPAFLAPVATTNAPEPVVTTTSEPRPPTNPAEGTSPSPTPAPNLATQPVGREDPAAVSAEQLHRRFFKSTYPSPPPSAFTLDIVEYAGYLGILSFTLKASGAKYSVRRLVLEVRGIASCPLRTEQDGGGAWPEWQYEFTLAREFSSYELVPLDDPGKPLRFEYDPAGHDHDNFQVALGAPPYQLFLVSVVVEGSGDVEGRRQSFAVESPLIPVIFLPGGDKMGGCLEIERWYRPHLLQPAKQAPLRDGLNILAYQLLTARLAVDDDFTHRALGLGDGLVDRAISELEAFAKRHPSYAGTPERLSALRDRFNGRGPAANSTLPDALPCSNALPWFMSRPLSDEDLVGLAPSVLAEMRNEVYARHGRRFTDAALQRNFEAMCWYEPKYLPSEFPKGVLSPLEHANLGKIMAAERAGRPGL